jgi:hypothetical protein
MKKIYRLCCTTVCYALIGFYSAQAQDYSQANYIPANLGNNVPNGTTDYTAVRERTTPAYINTDPETRLLAPVRMTELFSAAGNGTVELTWRTEYEPDLTRYEIEYSKDNITFQQVGVVTAGTYLNGKAYTFRHHPTNVRDRLWYRIKMVDKGGRFDYTPVLSQVVTGNVSNTIYPTVVNSGVVSLNLNDAFETVQIVDMQGRVLQAVNLNGRTGRTDIALSQAAKGICFVRVLGTQQNNQPRQNIVQKIFIQ